MIYFQLFVEFMKVGLFTIGGGLASLPYLYEISDKYRWVTYADVTNMIAISESTPGPIGINAATYIGFHVGGVFGGIIASLGVATPALIIVTIVAAALDKFKANRLVQYGFNGIRPVVAALITVAFFSIFTISVINLDGVLHGGDISELIDPLAALLFMAVFLLILLFKKHPIWYIVGGAFFGIFIAP